jgi:hypothetical protein
MKLRLSRRSVYVGTVVAMIAMVGGLAVAAISGVAFTSGTGNQNFGSITSASTIYGSSNGASATLNLVSGDSTSSGACATTSAYSGTVANIAVAGADASCPVNNEWYDLLTFTGVTVGSAVSDTFYIAVNGGTSGAGFTITSSGSITGTATLNIYIDDGPTSAAPLINSITVTVNGS